MFPISNGMKAFILAGGEGTRLRPVTYEVPKPLITVRKKPILNYLIELFEGHGVDHFLVSISKNHVADFEKWRREHHTKRKVDFIVEDKPLGTFGSLMLAKSQLSHAPFFMSNGDELKQFDLEGMKEQHAKHKPAATIGLVQVDNPDQYGVVLCDAHNVRQFLEKPKDPPANTISCGLYLMNPEVFDYYPHPDIRFAMVERDLFPKLVAQKRLNGYTLNGQWYDCGTFERWEKAIHEWSDDHKQ